MFLLTHQINFFVTSSLDFNIRLASASALQGKRGELKALHQGEAFIVHFPRVVEENESIISYFYSLVVVVFSSMPSTRMTARTVVTNAQTQSPY